MIHPSLKPILPNIIKAFKKHRIISASIFGSAVTDRLDKNSDIDFVVTIDQNLDPVVAGEHLWDLYYELKDLLGREVDILTESSLKNPYLIQEINRSKLPIYGY
jgi:predicted nucleotidyltransferase